MFDPARINRTLPPAFREKLRSAVEQPPEGADPFFTTYCGAVAQERGLATYLRAKQQMLSLVGGVKGRDVLDAGSGFGVYGFRLAVGRWRLTVNCWRFSVGGAGGLRPLL